MWLNQSSTLLASGAPASLNLLISLFLFVSSYPCWSSSDLFVSCLRSDKTFDSFSYAFISDMQFLLLLGPSLFLFVNFLNSLLSPDNFLEISWYVNFVLGACISLKGQFMSFISLYFPPFLQSPCIIHLTNLGRNTCWAIHYRSRLIFHHAEPQDQELDYIEDEPRE